MTHLPHTFLYLSLLLLSVSSTETPSSSPPEPDVNTFCDQVYENQHSYWLPPHYAHNANCACKAIPPTAPEGNCVRNFLVNRLNNDLRYNSDFKKKMGSLKSSETANESDYIDFLDNEFLPKIQEDHFDAYKECGCEGTPAGWWAWKMVTKVSLPCSIVKLGMLFLESCHKTPSKWEALDTRTAEVVGKDMVGSIQGENIVLSENEIEEKEYKEFKVMLEMVGALIFSLIIIFSAVMYCRQRRVEKRDKEFNASYSDYHYQADTFYSTKP